MKSYSKENTAPSTTASAGLILPHGAAPSSPVDGDVWTTTAGIFVRINGVTVGPLIAGTIPTAGGAPVNVTSAAAAAGVAGTFSRSDHKHDITVAAATTITPSSSNGAGSASSLARSDHTHAITSAAPSVNLSVSSTNAAGTAASVARSDHSHAITWPGATNGTATLATAFSLVSVAAAWENIGVSVTLPAAGTYLIMYHVRYGYQSASSAGQISARLYNSTDAAAVSGSNIMVVQDPSNLPTQSTVSAQLVVTVAASKAIRIECQRTNVAYTYSDILGDGVGGNGTTRLTYVRIA